MLAPREREPGCGCLFGASLAGCVVQAVAGGQWLSTRSVWALALLLASTVFLTLTCAAYAREQGRHPAWGLLGVLNVAGMLLLLILPELEAHAEERRPGFAVLGVQPARPWTRDDVEDERDLEGTMRVHVKLFAILRERAGDPELALHLPPGATIADAAEALAEEVPEIRSFLPRVAYALNESYAKPDAVLQDGDELAVIPPVSGG